ncbi:RNA-binding ribosome assembly factor RBP95 KNAG_0H01800 [Huiozyma naganishii CBS 8797]|uniref:WKF domain-containing protein n=1 Tax=Huiozyma naganishii (strain ATCC MYA-139 / BCRC 22969 / CBS 8797 / KCTC 17520 / NBRC 10181 / NCYC 3082 / Yp74L-3) TaxID=1071383 RepID=J7S8K3_HUIN7|nr:hypothetical protein KNAG_0H01800 [Kazachstania naganishii CBS 8797]CCK71594.1 hypothetical protein KNAG_0H01800 [Kazachstania naganishii CBS 8797]
MNQVFVSTRSSSDIFFPYETENFSNFKSPQYMVQSMSIDSSLTETVQHQDTPSPMSSEHIPAWKRIVLKEKQKDAKDSVFANDDPFNVTTHLASGSLSRKEKRKIIKGGNEPSKKKVKGAKAAKREQKREKLPREVRETKKSKVLKDQLRYLIEFYKFKVDKQLPQELYELESVSSNYSKEEEVDVDESNAVVDVWKFSKQKQNWVIRHFFSVDEIPTQYNVLLIAYLKDLSPKSRDDLIQKCRLQVNAWNTYTKEQRESINAFVAREAKDDAGEAGEDSAKSSSSEADDQKKQTAQDSTQTDHKEKKVEKSEEQAVPNKDVVSRCFMLLQEFLEKHELDELALIDLTS